MNEEAQRIAIAEACGWKFALYGKNRFRIQAPRGYRSDEWHTDDPDNAQILPAKETLEASKAYWIGGCPDYLNDLNAMHVAEKTLASREDCERFQNLLLLVKPSLVDATCAAERWTWHATAAQRAEAFLRTIGKWKDGK